MDVVGIADVAFDGVEGVADGVAHVGEVAFTAGEAVDLRALRGEGFGEGAAEPAARPGDDGDFVLEVHERRGG